MPKKTKESKVKENDLISSKIEEIHSQLNKLTFRNHKDRPTLSLRNFNKKSLIFVTKEIWIMASDILGGIIFFLSIYVVILSILRRKAISDITLESFTENKLLISLLISIGVIGGLYNYIKRLIIINRDIKTQISKK